MDTAEFVFYFLRPHSIDLATQTKLKREYPYCSAVETLLIALPPMVEKFYHTDRQEKLPHYALEAHLSSLHAERTHKMDGRISALHTEPKRAARPHAHYI